MVDTAEPVQVLVFRDLKVKFHQTGALFYILTSAEATCLAMMNIRLSVISHGGFTLSLLKRKQKSYLLLEPVHHLYVRACVLVTCL